MRTWGGPNAPHIKTLTLGKNIFIMQRATGNGPPDTKVVDVHLHGLSYNSLFISIRSRGRHPLTRLQRQKGPRKPLSLAARGAEQGWVFLVWVFLFCFFRSPPISHQSKAKKANKKKKTEVHRVTALSLVVRRQTDRVKKRSGNGRCFGRWSLQRRVFIFHPPKRIQVLDSNQGERNTVMTNRRCILNIYDDFIRSAIATPPPPVLGAPLHCRAHFGCGNGWVNVMRNNLL